MKGRIFNSEDDNYKKILTSKKSYFEEQEKLGELDGITADKKYELWFEETFGLAYAVTCHKLQGSTIRNKNIYIHIEDIMKWIAKNENNKVEYKKCIDSLHRFLYIAISRATKCNQIKIVATPYVRHNMLKLKKYCKDIQPFSTSNGIRTSSKTFDYDKFLSGFDTTEKKYLGREEEIEYASSHTYKEYFNKYGKSDRTWKRLRKEYRGQNSAHIYNAEKCPLENISESTIYSKNSDIGEKTDFLNKTKDIVFGIVDFFRPKLNI